MPPLLQMYFSLRMEEGWQSQVNKGSQLPQLHQLHQSSGLNRDNIHLSIYIRGSTLPTSLLSFQNRGCSGASHQPDPHLLAVNHHFLAHSSFFSPALALFALSRSQKPANVSFSNSVHVFTGITFSFSSSIFFALYHRLLVCGSLTFNVYAHCILSQPRQLLRDSVVVPSHRQRAPTA